MKVTVCIGSSCHLKGSRRIVEGLQQLIADNNLQNDVSLNGTFCMGRCAEGVGVKIDDEFHSVDPEEVNEFFNNEIKAKM